MSSRITILGSHDKELREWLLSHPQQHERGAWILCRLLSRKVDGLPQSDRFIVVDVIKMTDEWIVDSSEVSLDFTMRKLPEIYFRCEQEGLELGFVHNHPNKYSDFSLRDDENELKILKGVSGCNGSQSFLISLILVDGSWIARIRQGSEPKTVIPVRHIAVLGERMDIYGVGVDNTVSHEVFLRQESAFGKPFNHKLQSLRVGVVGVGGTGSPVATLLARAGVGEIILIDGDKLEASNMNRVRGYSKDDIEKEKAGSLANFINNLGLPVMAVAINKTVDHQDAIDALSSVDIIFGCTDDQIGRNILNQILYYYGQPLIDCGLSGSLGNDVEGHPYLQDHQGRVSCILPEYGACLRCQRVVTDERVAYEEALRRNPELANLDPETLEREHYLRGGGVQAPGVGPFTSMTGDFVVATFMDLIRGYRSLPTDILRDNIWIDFIHLNIHSNSPIDDPDCIFCRTNGVLLKKEEKYRLDMPKLGKI